MKYCKRCNSFADDSINFCASCGSNEFYTQNNQDTTVLNNNFDNQYVQPNSNINNSYNPNTNWNSSVNNMNSNSYNSNIQWNSSVSQQNQNIQPSFQPQVNIQAPAKKKGLRWWHILLIVLGVLFFIGVVFAIADSSSSDYDDSNYVNSHYDFDYSTEPEIEYSKGTVIGNIYTNLWADLKITLPNEYAQKILTDTSNYENEKTDCGLASINELKNKQLVIQFEDLSNYIQDYTVNEYLDILKESAKDSIGITIAEIEYSEYFNYKIAGEDYLSLRITNVDTGLTQYICCRMIDKHVITIVVLENSDQEAKDILNSFVSAN